MMKMRDMYVVLIVCCVCIYGCTTTTSTTDPDGTITVVTEGINPEVLLLFTTALEQYGDDALEYLELYIEAKQEEQVAETIQERQDAQDAMALILEMLDAFSARKVVESIE